MFLLSHKSFQVNSGISHQISDPYDHAHQNGVRQRELTMTIVEYARSMLHFVDLGIEFWAEAVSTAVYLKNKSPTSAVKGKTPQEAWSGRKPKVQH